MLLNKNQIIAAAIRTISIEAAALQVLKNRIDDKFVSACEIIAECRGRVILTGMGKSSHIARKIAATFASTGTPAFFVHPGEASHGDIGVVLKEDVMLAISNSGNTPEILSLLPVLKRLGVPLISLTGNSSSKLAQAANVNLDVGVETEACPLGLAPTASTTTALVMGDALAVSLLEAKGFTANDFARSHPGGILGKRLSLKISDLMRTGDAVPKVNDALMIKHALIEMTNKRMGFTAIVDRNDGKLLGVFTDGDLRRALENGIDVHQMEIGKVMTRDVKIIDQEVLAIEALKFMEKHKITQLLVLDANRKIVGAIHLHDLLSLGL